jgi:hypothetical protein
VLQPGYKVIGERLNPEGKEVWYNASVDKVRSDRACQDLLIWACLCNHASLAKYFWRQGGNSITTALTAVTLLRRIAQHPRVRSRGSFRKVMSEIIVLAADFEQLAMGTLRVCYTGSPSMTKMLLTTPILNMPGLQRHIE